MTQPTTHKGFHKFTGLVKYYHGIWAEHLHRLQPLTKLVSRRVKLNLTNIEQKARYNIKWIVACIYFYIINISIKHFSYTGMLSISKYEWL